MQKLTSSPWGRLFNLSYTYKEDTNVEKSYINHYNAKKNRTAKHFCLTARFLSGGAGGIRTHETFRPN